MCHNNLDFRQKAISRRSEDPIEMPILYITELLGLALGLEPKVLGLHRHYVSPKSLLDRLPGSSKSLEAGSKPKALLSPPREEA